MPSLAKASSKAQLKHCREQLVKIMKECGHDFGDNAAGAAVETGKCPFYDALARFTQHMNAFEKALEECRISRSGDRTELASGMSTCYALLFSADKALETMNTIIVETELKVNKYLNKKNDQKAKKYKAKADDFRNKFYEASNTKKQGFEALNLEAELQRSLLSRMLLAVRGRLPASRQPRDTYRETVSGARNLLKDTTDIARQLEALPYDGPAVDLRHALETRTQMAKIEQQKKEIASGLKELSKQLEVMKQQQLKLRDEIMRQTTEAGSLADRIHSQADQVARLRYLQDKFLEEESPCQFFCTCFCFVLVLAMGGYFMYKFGLIPT